MAPIAVWTSSEHPLAAFSAAAEAEVIKKHPRSAAKASDLRGEIYKIDIMGSLNFWPQQVSEASRRRATAAKQGIGSILQLSKYACRA